MPIQHTNRKGDVYYLHVGKTKKGNPKYHFSKKKKGELADLIPDGYEIYENPNAQVFLRKIIAKLVTDDEIAMVEHGIRELAKLDLFIIDVKKDAIVIFTAENTLDAVDGLAEKLGPLFSPALGDLLIKSAYYMPMMRFVLTDEEDREFRVDRWCFRGSVDDWIFLGSSSDLRALVRKYCPHLGKESFYDLM